VDPSYDETTQPSLDVTLEEAIANRIERKLGKPFKPKQIHIVSELPTTRNAKVMRRIIKRIYCGEPPGDLSALENPNAISAIPSMLSVQLPPQD
jgi:acetyl-CoA synthetase